MNSLEKEKKVERREIFKRIIINERDEREKRFIESEFEKAFQNLKIVPNLKKTSYFHLFFILKSEMEILFNKNNPIFFKIEQSNKMKTLLKILLDQISP